MAAGSSSGFTSRSQCGGRFTIGTQLTRRGAAAARNSKPIGSAGRFYKSNPIVPEPSTGRPTKRTRLAVRPGVGQFEAKWAAQPPGQITKRTHLAGRWDRDNRTIDAGQFEPNFAGATGRIQFESPMRRASPAPMKMGENERCRREQQPKWLLKAARIRNWLDRRVRTPDWCFRPE